jgi:hypothetical protein
MVVNKFVNDGCSRFESPQGWDIHTAYYYVYLYNYSYIYIETIDILYVHLGCDLEEQLNCIAGSIGSIISVCRWSHPIWTHLSRHLPRPRRHESGKLKMNRRNWCRVLRESPWIPGVFRISSGWGWMGCCLVWSQWMTHPYTCLSRWIFHVELPRTRTYTAQRVLGKGSFGVVYQAWWIGAGDAKVWHRMKEVGDQQSLDPSKHASFLPSLSPRNPGASFVEPTSYQKFSCAA